jgi:hypothetical protein
MDFWDFLDFLDSTRQDFSKLRQQGQHGART